MCKPSSSIPPNWEIIRTWLGYTEEELRAVPEGANSGIGCGNSVALTSLKEREVVVDLAQGLILTASL